MMRIFLFLATNIAIMVVISIVFSLLGLSGTLDAQGLGLDLNALLVMSAVIGMTGSFISLAMSKWSAKRAMGVHVIEQPQNQTERWLLWLNRHVWPESVCLKWAFSRPLKPMPLQQE